MYLLPEYGDADSEREILDDFWPDLFAAMLNCWLTDEQQWPKNRTHQMFGEWFDLQMCPVVEDLHLDEVNRTGNPGGLSQATLTCSS